jgi:hypothetical protein
MTMIVLIRRYSGLNLWWAAGGVREKRGENDALWFGLDSAVGIYERIVDDL